jgi:hypothetical protein
MGESDPQTFRFLIRKQLGTHTEFGGFKAMGLAHGVFSTVNKIKINGRM